MKGIILAGGSGTRLYPLTRGVSKQLLPIYDKPMIYYPLSILMLTGIQEVLIISTPEDLPRFKNLLGNGSEIGMNFQYQSQLSPDGIAQAFILGEEFIGSDSVTLVLGDNIFYGHGITELLNKGMSNALDSNEATIFGYHVNKPSHYGVVGFDHSGQATSIEEKPEKPKSSYAVTGLYIYPNDVVKKALTVLPSKRGELEITSINQMYLKEDRLKVELLGRGYAWLDTGTHEDLKRQGLKVACIEEIAFEQGFISKEKLLTLANSLKNNQYGQYLLRHIKSEKFNGNE